MLLAVSTCEETINLWYLMGILITIVKIIVPLIVIIFGIIDVTAYITKDPSKETKVLISKIFKRLAAALIVFMVPTLITSLIEMLTNQKVEDNKCTICLNKPNEDKCQEYLQEAKDRRKEEELEEETPLFEGDLDTRSLSGGKRKGKNGELDFSYEGNGSVKSQFSADTLEIVENHLNDFNYYNYEEVIDSYGGFDKYVKSLGGVFEEYYGQDLEVTTYYELQRVAEYVFGFIYMFGFDYQSGSTYHEWGGSGHSDDAFYPGNLRGDYPPNRIPLEKEFDTTISGGLSKKAMLTECGFTVSRVLFKAGVQHTGEEKHVEYITRFRDLRPGDVMYFFDEPVGNKAIRSTWGRGRHNVLVGEVYDDRVVIYDGGSHFQNTKNFKRVMRMVDSEAEEYAEVRKEFGFGGWASERFKTIEEEG